VDPLHSSRQVPRHLLLPCGSSTCRILLQREYQHSRALKVTVTSDVASVPAPYKIPARLPKNPISSSVAEELPRSVMEVDRSFIKDPEENAHNWPISLFSLRIQLSIPCSACSCERLTFPGTNFCDMIQRHYRIHKGSFSFKSSSQPVYPNELPLGDQAGLAHGMTISVRALGPIGSPQLSLDSYLGRPSVQPPPDPLSSHS